MKALLAALLLLPCICLGQIKLKTGIVLTGTLGKFTPETVQVITASGTVVIPTTQLDADYCKDALPQSVNARRIRENDQTQAGLAEIQKQSSEIEADQNLQNKGTDLLASTAKLLMKKVDDLDAENTRLRKQLALPAADIPRDILASIKADVAKRYPMDFDMQLFLIKEQTEAYLKLHASDAATDSPTASTDGKPSPSSSPSSANKPSWQHFHGSALGGPTLEDPKR